MLGTQAVFLCKVSCQSPIPVGEGLWSAESELRHCNCDCIYAVWEGSCCTRGQKKKLEKKGGALSKEVTGPDDSDVLIMRKQTALGLYLPRLCLLQTECLH